MIHALRTKASSFLILIALATAGTAVAGTFSISPIRVELSAGQRTEALTVRNEEAARDVVVQAHVMAWSQKDGEEVLTESADVLVTPPIFKLAGNSQQIVRVALRRPPDPKRELTYRLILQEVPGAPPKDFTGLQVALRLSLPVFLTSQSKSAPDVVWNAKWRPDGSLQVIATNRGTAHLQISDFTVESKTTATVLKNSVVKYVLPGSTINWVLKPPSDAAAGALRQGALLLRGMSDRGELSVDLTAAGD